MRSHLKQPVKPFISNDLTYFTSRFGNLWLCSELNLYLLSKCDRIYPHSPIPKAQ
ncbi:hypothetical protein [Nostoc sp. ChiVER01]|uniref:hypothetical protein n=1 Tax=Nostoc sp. ChiVER01 TaxID=3075382 RepID=UPI002AD4D36A|nr:hypothetical protein [Nostoc sp. ChiVER01]MDZ8227543.1 hypothetical protein [Nostoc sp. ChiVER01]